MSYSKRDRDEVNALILKQAKKLGLRIGYVDLDYREI